MSEFLNNIHSSKPTEAVPVEETPIIQETPAVETEAPVEPAPETQAEAPEIPAEPTDDVQKVVPLKALQEERRQNKELSDRLRQIEDWARQASQPQVKEEPQDERPDIETDPIGAIKWMDKKLRESQEAQQGRDAETRLQSVYASSAREFAIKTPDFKDAYEFAITSRGKQLAALGYDVGTINETIRAEEMNLAAQALQNGRNPAEVIYEFAKSYGYQGKAPAPATQAAIAPAVDPTIAATLQKAKQAAATSISTGGKPPKGEFDPASLVNLHGAAFDAAWEKFAKQSGARSNMFRE